MTTESLCEPPVYHDHLVGAFDDDTEAVYVRAGGDKPPVVLAHLGNREEISVKRQGVRSNSDQWTEESVEAASDYANEHWLDYCDCEWDADDDPTYDDCQCESRENAMDWWLDENGETYADIDDDDECDWSETKFQITNALLQWGGGNARPWSPFRYLCAPMGLDQEIVPIGSPNTYGDGTICPGNNARPQSHLEAWHQYWNSRHNRDLQVHRRQRSRSELEKLGVSIISREVSLEAELRAIPPGLRASVQRVFEVLEGTHSHTRLNPLEMSVLRRFRPDPDYSMTEEDYARDLFVHEAIPRVVSEARAPTPQWAENRFNAERRWNALSDWDGAAAAHHRGRAERMAIDAERQLESQRGLNITDLLRGMRGVRDRMSVCPAGVDMWTWLGMRHGPGTNSSWYLFNEFTPYHGRHRWLFYDLGRTMSRARYRALTGHLTGEPKIFSKIREAIGPPTLENIALWMARNFVAPAHAWRTAVRQAGFATIEEAVGYGLRFDEEHSETRNHYNLLNNWVNWVFGRIRLQRAAVEFEDWGYAHQYAGWSPIIPDWEWAELTKIPKPVPGFCILALDQGSNNPEVPTIWMAGSGLFRGLLEQGVELDDIAWQYDCSDPSLGRYHLAAMLPAIRHGGTIFTEVAGRRFRGRVQNVNSITHDRSTGWDAVARRAGTVIIWGEVTEETK